MMVSVVVVAGCADAGDEMSESELLDLCETARRFEVADGTTKSYEELDIATKEEWGTDLTDDSVLIDGWTRTPDQDGLYYVRGRTGNFKWFCVHSEVRGFTRWAADD